MVRGAAQAPAAYRDIVPINCGKGLPESCPTRCEPGGSTQRVDHCFMVIDMNEALEKTIAVRR